MARWFTLTVKNKLSCYKISVWYIDFKIFFSRLMVSKISVYFVYRQINES